MPSNIVASVTLRDIVASTLCDESSRVVESAESTSSLDDETDGETERTTRSTAASVTHQFGLLGVFPAGLERGYCVVPRCVELQDGSVANNKRTVVNFRFEEVTAGTRVLAAWGHSRRMLSGAHPAVAPQPLTFWPATVRRLCGEFVGLSDFPDAAIANFGEFAMLKEYASTLPFILCADVVFPADESEARRLRLVWSLSSDGANESMLVSPAPAHRSGPGAAAASLSSTTASHDGAFRLTPTVLPQVISIRNYAIASATEDEAGPQPRRRRSRAVPIAQPFASAPISAASVILDRTCATRVFTVLTVRDDAALESARTEALNDLQERWRRVRSMLPVVQQLVPLEAVLVPSTPPRMRPDHGTHTTHSQPAAAVGAPHLPTLSQPKRFDVAHEIERPQRASFLDLRGVDEPIHANHPTPFCMVHSSSATTPLLSVSVPPVRHSAVAEPHLAPHSDVPRSHAGLPDRKKPLQEAPIPVPQLQGARASSPWQPVAAVASSAAVAPASHASALRRNHDMDILTEPLPPATNTPSRPSQQWRSEWEPLEPRPTNTSTIHHPSPVRQRTPQPSSSERRRSSTFDQPNDNAAHDEGQDVVAVDAVEFHLMQSRMRQMEEALYQLLSTREISYDDLVVPNATRGAQQQHRSSPLSNSRSPPPFPRVAAPVPTSAVRRGQATATNATTTTERHDSPRFRPHHAEAAGAHHGSGIANGRTVASSRGQATAKPTPGKSSTKGSASKYAAHHADPVAAGGRLSPRSSGGVGKREGDKPPSRDPSPVSVSHGVRTPRSAIGIDAHYHRQVTRKSAIKRAAEDIRKHGSTFVQRQQEKHLALFRRDERELDNSPILQRKRQVLSRAEGAGLSPTGRSGSMTPSWDSRQGSIRRSRSPLEHPIDAFYRLSSSQSKESGHGVHARRASSPYQPPFGAPPPAPAIESARRPYLPLSPRGIIAAVATAYHGHRADIPDFDVAARDEEHVTANTAARSRGGGRPGHRGGGDFRMNTLETCPIRTS